MIGSSIQNAVKSAQDILATRKNPDADTSGDRDKAAEEYGAINQYFHGNQSAGETLVKNSHILGNTDYISESNKELYQSFRKDTGIDQLSDSDKYILKKLAESAKGENTVSDEYFAAAVKGIFPEDLATEKMYGNARAKVLDFVLANAHLSPGEITKRFRESKFAKVAMGATGSILRGLGGINTPMGVRGELYKQISSQIGGKNAEAIINGNPTMEEVYSIVPQMTNAQLQQAMSLYQSAIDKLAPELGEYPELEKPTTEALAIAAVVSAFLPSKAFATMAQPFQYMQNIRNQKIQEQNFRYGLQVDKYKAELSGFEEGIQQAGLSDRADYAGRVSMFNNDQDNKVQLAIANQKAAVSLSNADKKYISDAMKEVADPRTPLDRVSALVNTVYQQYGIDISGGVPIGKSYTEREGEAQIEYINAGKMLREADIQVRLSQVEKNAADIGLTQARTYQVAVLTELAEKEFDLDTLKAYADIDRIKQGLYDKDFDLKLKQATASMSALNSMAKSLESGISDDKETLRKLTTELSASGILANSRKPDEIKADIETIEANIKTKEEALNGLNEERKQVTQSINSMERQVVEPSSSHGGKWKTNLGANMVGKKYSWGGGDYRGTSKGIERDKDKVGFDCSGFTEYVAYQDFGKRIPGTCIQQFNKLEKVDESAAMTGDFIYWANKSKTKWHTGILIWKDGEWWVRHAGSSSGVTTVKLSSLDSSLSKRAGKHFVGIRRAHGG